MTVRLLLGWPGPKQVQRILAAILSLERAIMAELDDLRTAVSGLETQLAANKALLQQLKAALDALASQTTINPADVAALAAQITTDTAGLAADDAANTPAPPAS